MDSPSSIAKTIQTALPNPTNSIIPLGVNNNVPVDILPTSIGKPATGHGSSTDPRHIDPTALIIGSVCGVLVAVFVSVFWVRRHRKLQSAKVPATSDLTRFPGKPMPSNDVTSTNPSTGNIVPLAILPETENIPSTLEQLVIDVFTNYTEDANQQHLLDSERVTNNASDSASLDSNQFIDVDLSNDDFNDPQTTPGGADEPLTYESFPLSAHLAPQSLSTSALNDCASSSLSTLSDFDECRARNRASAQSTALSHISSYSFAPSLGEAAPPNLTKEQRTVTIKIPWQGVNVGEMTVDAGDVVEVVRRFEHGWGWGQNITTGSRGMFPMDLVCERESVEMVMEAARLAVDEIAQRFNGFSFLQSKRKETIQRRLATKGMNARLGNLPAPISSAMSQSECEATSDGLAGIQTTQQHNPDFDEQKLAFRLWLQAEIELDNASEHHSLYDD